MAQGTGNERDLEGNPGSSKVNSKTNIDFNGAQISPLEPFPSRSQGLIAASVERGVHVVMYMALVSLHSCWQSQQRDSGLRGKYLLTLREPSSSSGLRDIGMVVGSSHCYCYMSCILSVDKQDFNLQSCHAGTLPWYLLGEAIFQGIALISLSHSHQRLSRHSGQVVQPFLPGEALPHTSSAKVVSKMKLGTMGQILSRCQSE